MKRMPPKDRREQILGCAIECAIRDGWNKITRESVALEAGVSVGLVSHYFDSMENLKKQIMQDAVEFHIVTVVAQGLAMGDDTARSASPALVEQAISHMRGA